MNSRSNDYFPLETYLNPDQPQTPVGRGIALVLTLSGYALGLKSEICFQLSIVKALLYGRDLMCLEIT